MPGYTDNRLRPLVAGANFRTSTLAIRDRLAVEDSQIPEISRSLSSAGVPQALVLSTCDRIEVLAVHEDPTAAAAKILKILSDHAQEDEAVVAEQVYVHAGKDALRHMMRVASSLDSQIIGEPQVLGQVKAAHRLARVNQMVGSALDNILNVCYSAAKRVRSETKIGEFPVSIAAAMCQLARDVHGDLAACRVLLLGDGDMGELVARYLLNAGAGRLVVSHPTGRRAEALAARLGCHATPWQQLSASLIETEIVVTAIGARTYSLNADMMASTVKGRHHKLSFAVDLAFPGDIDPAVNRIDEVFLYALSDLEQLAAAGLNQRETEASCAAAIIEEELERWADGVGARTAVPILNRLRSHVEGLRQQAVLDAKGDVEKATNLLANRLLHDPMIALRDYGAGSNLTALRDAEQVLEHLFQLNYQHTDDDVDGE